MTRDLTLKAIFPSILIGTKQRNKHLIIQRPSSDKSSFGKRSFRILTEGQLKCLKFDCDVTFFVRNSWTTTYKYILTHMHFIHIARMSKTILSERSVQIFYYKEMSQLIFYVVQNVWREDLFLCKNVRADKKKNFLSDSQLANRKVKKILFLVCSDIFQKISMIFQTSRKRYTSAEIFLRRGKRSYMIWIERISLTSRRQIDVC